MALFHETQSNGWFWWSKGTGAQFIALYKYAFDYLTGKGLGNIVWLMPFSGSPSSAYFPGAEYVDISGPDTYSSGQPFSSLYSQAKGVIGSTMPIPLHETGTVPQPSSMFPSSAPWLLWNIWAGYQKSSNALANVQSAYSSTYTIARDLVQNLK